MTAPKRRFEIVLKLSGDEIKDLIRGLDAIAFDLESGARGPSVSGGVSSGWSWQLEENADMTHDLYVKQLHEYLAELNKKEPV